MFTVFASFTVHTAPLLEQQISRVNSTVPEGESALVDGRSFASLEVEQDGEGMSRSPVSRTPGFRLAGLRRLTSRRKCLHVCYPLDGRIFAAASAAPAEAEAATSAVPGRRILSDLRSSSSIFCRMSVFSLRNCFTFSRPCPMRSPL